MPLTLKGRKVMRNMKREYGEKKGEEVFYASRNKGTITGVERKGRRKVGRGHWPEEKVSAGGSQSQGW